MAGFTVERENSIPFYIRPFRGINRQRIQNYTKIIAYEGFFRNKNLSKGELNSMQSSILFPVRQKKNQTTPTNSKLYIVV